MALLRKFSIVIAVFLFIFILAGCASDSTDAFSQTATYEMASEAAAMPEESISYDEETISTDTDGSSLNTPTDGRQITFSSNVYMETSEFEASQQALTELLQKHNAYIDYTDIYSDVRNSRSAYYSIKVPAGSYSDFLADLNDVGQILNLSEQSEDLTSQVIDVEARLESLNRQEARLLALLDETGELSDLILLQDQLAQVQYEIESYLGHQRALQNLISYSTISIDIAEVNQLSDVPEEDTYLSRLVSTFQDSLYFTVEFFQDLSLMLIWMMPVWILLIVVLIIVVIIVRINRKKRKNRPTPPPPTFYPQNNHQAPFYQTPPVNTPASYPAPTSVYTENMAVDTADISESVTDEETTKTDETSEDTTLV